ncbi:hypothetical protein B566_EDAN015546 [Ephemera danica]|nr:hypothetical protein B566_EDAN015546 [Ephemera danica]
MKLKQITIPFHRTKIMTTRSLTEVFVLMRNNATQSRHIYSEQRMSDRMSLVSTESEAVHLLISNGTSDTRQPPGWVDSLEEAQYSLSRLRGKLRELEALHARHLHRPTLDDSSEEEMKIEILTKEVTRMVSSTHRTIQQIRLHSNSEARHGKEQRLSYNVVSSLVTSLQELSNAFRESQGNYLRKLSSREERSKQYFTMPDELETEQQSAEDVLFGLPPGGGGALTSQQLLVLADNTVQAEQRETEVRKIVSSIQLQKADRYQRSNRKMKCIVGLAITTIIMFVFLLIVKS